MTNHDERVTNLVARLRQAIADGGDTTLIGLLEEAADALEGKPPPVHQPEHPDPQP